MQRNGQKSQFAGDHRTTRLDRRVTGINPGLKRPCMVAAEGFKRLDKKLDSIIETQRKARSALERSSTLAALREEVRRKLAERIAAPKRPLSPAPRYDEVFAAGTEWLNALAGEASEH